MRRLREVLRLRYGCGLSLREIARGCSMGPGTVWQYLSRAEGAGVSWPLPEGLDEVGLERRVFGEEVGEGAGPRRVLPDFAHVHEELRRPGVTLQLLCLEYLEVNSEGYRYSQFCKLYRRWVAKLSLSMRQVHRAGEKAFLDYAGKRPHLVDPGTGEIREVELFVGVLGASSYVYAEAALSQDLPSFIGVQVRMLEAWGGVPAILVPDNLKSAVTRSCRYEPQINRTYEDFATHYGAAVIPARARRPKDKAKVEVSVLLAERWILAALRNRTFFSLADLNGAILEKLVLLNNRPMKKLGLSRPSVPI